MTKIVDRAHLLRKLPTRIGLLVLVITFGVSAGAQEVTPSSSLFAPQSQGQAPEAARERRSAINCFDAGPYIVAVIDIIEGDTPGYRRARLVLRFENLTNSTLVLGYRSGSSFMVDNFRNQYSCCRTDSGEDTSAIGIGVDRDDKVNPQFMLKPRASDTVSFDLWRHRPPDQQASYYHFDVMIDEIDPSGLKTILRHTVLFFRSLPARPPEADQKR